jgi:hypothetical protein
VLGLQPDDDTLEAAVREFDVRRLRHARALRRAFFALLGVFVLAGAVNVLGERSATASAGGGGYELEVTYATVSRPGQDGDWDVEVRRPGGFGEPVRLATDISYLDVFDQTSVRPEPRSSTTSGGRTIWEFEPPVGDTLEITLEGQFEQDSMGVHRGVTGVLGPSGEVVEVAYRTVVLP